MLDPKHIHTDWKYFFETVHTDNGWITPLLEIITDIDVEEASWRPAEGLTSIWEIVAHASGHLTGLLADLNGKNGVDILDWPTVETGSKQAWELMVAQFVDQIRQLERHVRGHNADEIYETISGCQRRKSERMSEIFVHNAYHAGQIVKMRQLHALLRPLITN